MQAGAVAFLGKPFSDEQLLPDHSFNLTARQRRYEDDVITES